MMATELAAMAAEDLTLYGGMPLPLLMAVLTVAGSVATVVVTQLIKKFRTPQDVREDKVVVLEASDQLIQRFQQIVKDSDEKHAADIAKLSGEVQTLREELDVVKAERLGLLWAVRQLIRIAKKHGGAAAQLDIDSLELSPTLTSSR